MEQITNSVRHTRTLVEDVSTASAQQAQGLDQIAGAVVQMEKVTQTTAATSEESAAAAEELSAQAEVTMNEVGTLQALIVRVREANDSVASTRPARAAGSNKVLTLKPGARSARREKATSPEEQIPLRDTGTFGGF